MRGGEAGEKRNRQRGVGSVCVGEQVLSRCGGQFGRASDPGGAIQNNLFDAASGGLHWKNINMLRGAMQGGYNFRK